MTRATSTASPRLRLVRPGDKAIDQLLDALDQWASAADGEPAAYLEIGDDEIRGGFTLTQSQATNLAALRRRP